MRIVFAGNKSRGAACLLALHRQGHEIAHVLVHPGRGRTVTAVRDAAAEVAVPVSAPVDVNDPDVIAGLASLSADLVVMAGYGQIVRQPFLDLARMGAVNLHAGRLPQYRGSSPMNWALLNGETEFTLSVIAVDTGVDTGDVLAERTFPIGPDDTIADLGMIADEQFPLMLVEVVDRFAAGTTTRRRQDEDAAGYWPLRFPGDGLTLWDLHSAKEIHNRVRALTDPYPNAFTYWRGRRIDLKRSRLSDRRYYGEPGRVYRKTDAGLFICASDRCLWIEVATFADDGLSAVGEVARYDVLATVRRLMLDERKRGL